MDSQEGASDREKAKTSSSSSTPLAVVASYWRDFDLENEKSILDEQGLRIAENQDVSQKNRRKLAESIRGFIKVSNEDKLSLFNSLLKGYQEEILTRLLLQLVVLSTKHLRMLQLEQWNWRKRIQRYQN
ncbi:hypothetical protein K7X08_024099 [Anisodus acutangulus]|uniref:Cux N-terminal domain-containing protein n=1 Tax=Anisodus acutangulus TaxID=402998 RepID=A0A9Q1MAG8_9SOLA|nr:hypothetical protein K7X08_024099 [Anisodus acutangulus]